MDENANLKIDKIFVVVDVGGFGVVKMFLKSMNREDFQNYDFFSLRCTAEHLCPLLDAGRSVVSTEFQTSAEECYCFS